MRTTLFRPTALMYAPKGFQIIFILELPEELQRVQIPVSVSYALGLQFNLPRMWFGLCRFQQNFRWFHVQVSLETAGINTLSPPFLSYSSSKMWLIIQAIPPTWIFPCILVSASSPRKPPTCVNPFSHCSQVLATWDRKPHGLIILWLTLLCSFIGPLTYLWFSLVSLLW